MTSGSKSRNSNPRVSVIVPTFNRARDLVRCLDSLTAQTYRDFEVIVCDDGSTDNSASVVKIYESSLDLTYRWNENFGGPARPRNIGVRHARGEFVAFLDSDDWWAPEKLAESVRVLDGGADIVYHDLYLVFDATNINRLRKTCGRELSRPVVDDLLGGGNPISNSSVVARTALMRRIEGFSEERELIAAEDYDAWVRLAHITDAFVRIPRCLGYYWMGSGNISNPRRTISTSRAIEARYARELAGLRLRREVYWLGYVKARSHFLLGEYEEAVREFSMIRWVRVPATFLLRAGWMRIVMFFARRTKACE